MVRCEGQRATLEVAEAVQLSMSSKPQAAAHEMRVATSLAGVCRMKASGDEKGYGSCAATTAGWPAGSQVNE